jgi:hypothetical protein
MQRLIEILALIFTILFVMGLGASAYHQHEVLARKARTERTYNYTKFYYVTDENNTENP